ncbi:MAG: hypothetical protein L3K00_00730 [Thermoplasmata archaeon]|nr:hypothetical protein [Thermoplasmata archaeon]
MQTDTCNQPGDGALPSNRPAGTSLPPTNPSSILARPRRTTLLALGAVFVLAILASSATPLPSASTSNGAFGPSSPIQSSAYGNCNPVGTQTPSAILQGIPVPSTNVTPGGNLSAVMQVEAQNWVAADSNISVHFPSIFFDFPRASGGNQQLFFTNRSILMNFSGWSTPSFGSTKNYTFPSGLQFEAGAKARIDSMKLAVTATVDYGGITIEIRWHWTYTSAPGVSITSPWSVPTTKTNWPKAVPSIFWPAPYTTYLNSTGISAVIGTNWSATLGGDVGGRTFFLEMEYPSGSVVQDLQQTAPANATTFLVQIPMVNYDHYLDPGAFLIHIHDACGAMLYSKTVNAVFPPSATVGFFLTPSACATHFITFNGTKYGNGTTGVFLPSATGYSMSIPACTGHPFSGWSTTGAMHIENGHTMIVSNSGTFTVNYS